MICIQTLSFILDFAKDPLSISFHTTYLPIDHLLTRLGGTVNLKANVRSCTNILSLLY